MNKKLIVPAEEFECKGYVKVDFSSVLSTERINHLCDRLEYLIAHGQTEHDNQCPLSHSVYGDAVFDQLLIQLQWMVEQAVGEPLLPTYTYCRKYVRGEVLKDHTDRPECEVSVTMTLKRCEVDWPIYFSTKSKNDSLFSDVHVVKRLSPGEGIVYNGIDIHHWREQFEGDEQIQIFCHYVRANGQYRDRIYDNRGALGVSKTQSNKQTNIQTADFWQFDDVLTDEQCDAIIAQHSNDVDRFIEGRIGGGILDANVRNVRLQSIEKFRGVGANAVACGFLANQQAWKFDITHCSQIDYLVYKENSHYVPHLDTLLQYPQQTCRKLTVLVFLSDPQTYTGGDLFIQSRREKTYVQQKRGSVIVFPSFLLHGVDPITSGERHTVVCWLDGPSFR